MRKAREWRGRRAALFAIIGYRASTPTREPGW
jgi:hypothetical protein